jgi:hypothetical protein
VHAEDSQPGPRAPSVAEAQSLLPFLAGLPSMDALATAPLRYLETLCDITDGKDTEGTEGTEGECDEKALRALFNRMDGATKVCVWILITLYYYIFGF